MQLGKVRELLDAAVCCGEERLDEEVSGVCGSDYLSEVLAYVREQDVLLTGLVNPQVVRTAEMTDIRCIVFVRDTVPDQRMIRMAEERGIVLMTTGMQLHQAFGVLSGSGLRD